MKFKILIIGLIAACLCIGSCEENDDFKPEDSVSIDFNNALLQKFPLSEVDLNIVDQISIQQPKLINGIPQEKGIIEIELENIDIAKFSLKQVDFKTSDFRISPAIGEQAIIPGKKNNLHNQFY